MSGEIANLEHTEPALPESEARFRELADNIGHLVWAADATGWIYWYNKRWHDYTGTTPEEVQGWGWQQVHHPDHLERVLNSLRQSFDNGTPWEDTFPLRGRDGTYRWFLSRALPIRNETGDVVRWFGSNTDVTEQVEAERALRELNEALEQRLIAQARERNRIWDVCRDLLVVADGGGRFLSVNPAWTATLGWSETDLIGKASGWLLHPDDREASRAEFARLAAGSRTVNFENRYRRKDGSYCWLSWRAVLDQDLVYAVARDVTEFKRAEDALRASRQELARVARQTTMGEMAASIAHEINQPLAAIVANGNAGLRWLASATPDLDEARTALKRIVDDGHRASQVISSIRAMFGKGVQERSSVDVNDIIGEVVALVQDELQSKRVSLQMDLVEALPQVTANRVQLQQVILNLITNAAEAMSTTSDRARMLRVKSRREDDGGVLVAVEDSGTGIDPEDTDRIFDPFFTTKAEGMGMGLSICRSIINAHGGRLWATANVPRGSVFHVLLPATERLAK